MDNKKYKMFISYFEKTSANIGKCHIPQDALDIAENEISSLFEKFLKTIEYLKSTNSLSNEKRTELQNEIRMDIYRSYKPIEKKIREFEDHSSKYHFDKGMRSVLSEYYNFLDLVKKEFESIPDYESKNPDYKLTSDKIKLRTHRNHQYSYDLEDYRGITFKNDEFLHHFHNLLKQRVAKKNSFILLKLLEGENINGKIKFSGHQKLLCFYFNYPLVHGLITCNRDELIDWLIKNFDYVVKGESKPVLFKSIKNYVVTNINHLPERVKNKDEIADMVDDFLSDEKI